MDRNTPLENVVEILCENIEMCIDFIKAHDGYTDRLEKAVQQARCNSAIREMILTTAPKDYDYGYVVEVDPNWGTFCGKKVRLVAIPHTSKVYQCGRYDSGLNPWVSYDHRDTEVWVEKSA